VSHDERRQAETRRLETFYHHYDLAAVAASPDTATEAVEENFSPNPVKENLSFTLDEPDHIGNGTTFRKLRFRYKGTHSEGNRYIRYAAMKSS